MTTKPAAHPQSYIVGRRIVALRQDQGLSSGDLARRLGWPRDTLVNYEIGRRGITMEILVTIAAALRVPPAALLVDDAALAQIVIELNDSPEAVADVAFFLRTRDEEPFD